MSALGVILRDSSAYTDEGRALLVYLGAVDPDPLLVEAERWLETHEGDETPTTRRVRASLQPWPDELMDAAERMRRTPWKGQLR